MTQTLKEKAAYLLAKGWKPGHREMEHNYDYKDLIRDIRPEAYTCDLAGLTVESLVVTCASLIDGGEPPNEDEMAVLYLRLRPEELTTENAFFTLRDAVRDKRKEWADLPRGDK